MSTPTNDAIDVPYEGAALVQQYAGGVPEDLETGMDELEDASYPRLRINHKEARYVESIGDTEYETLDNVIVLGFSYSRVMWKERKSGTFDSSERPQCRSNDNQHGQPNTDIEKPSLFPWRDSVFDPSKAQVNPTYNRVLLDCQKCNFQIWGGDGSRPACGLIMTVYVLYQPPGADQPITAFLSIKGAGIRPMKKFFQSIRQRGSDATPYQFMVRLGLEEHTSGDVTYCTPTVEVKSVVDKAAWAALSAHYASMRDFTKAIIIEADDKEISANGFTPPVSSDPNFFMSVNELKEGIDPTATGGGRRSAAPPQRSRELASGQSDGMLASIMGGQHTTIQGTVTSSTTLPRQQTASPTQPAQSQAPVQTGQPTSAPAQAAVTVAAPPPQPPVVTPASAPVVQQVPQAPAPAAFNPLGGMQMGMGLGVPVAAPQVTQVAQVATVPPSPWEEEIPPAPAGYVPPTVDAPYQDDEPEADLTDESYPFT